MKKLFLLFFVVSVLFSCEKSRTGCTDPQADNFDPKATEETIDICNYSAEIVFYLDEATSIYMQLMDISFYAFYDNSTNDLIGFIDNDHYWLSPPDCIQETDLSNLVVGPLIWSGNYDNNEASFTWSVFADDGDVGTIVTDIIYPNSCNPLVLAPGMIKDNTTKLD